MNHYIYIYGGNILLSKKEIPCLRLIRVESIHIEGDYHFSGDINKYPPLKEILNSLYKSEYPCSH